jgi:16S rRNA (uracil1498-N3)-methyltransferase
MDCGSPREAITSVSTRVFVAASCAAGQLVSLTSADTRHLRLVLRVQRGDEVTVVSNATAWRARVEDIAGDSMRVQIVEPMTVRGELPQRVTVLQAIPKGTKMDEVIEKVTELGASRIVPIRCQRTYGGESAAKLDRWRRIARSAAAQSQRLIVPSVDASMDVADALAAFSRDTRVLVAWEQAARGSLALALAGEQRPLSIAIGPEGSFTEEELQQAQGLGCDLVSLGPTTLRTETAAAAAIAAIAVTLSWW